jgi:PAS domain S-box-containing protein
MRWSTKRKLTLGLTLAIAVLVVNALVTFWNIGNVLAGDRWVIHTREVVSGLDEVLAAVREAESAQRGYLLTGDASFLEQAESAEGRIPASLAHLRAVTSDNTRQQGRLPLLERQVQARLDLLRQSTAMRRQRGLDAAVRGLVEGPGERAMDELRASLAGMKREEEGLLDRRTRQVQASTWWTVATFSIASLLAIGLLATTGYSVWSEAVSRQRSALAIRRFEARETAILESALDAVIVMDHDGRVVEFNPAAERTFGHPRGRALGAEVAELIIPPALREAHRRGLAGYLATGAGPVLGRRVELTAQRSDGTEFPVEVAITRIPIDGPPMFTAYIRDISARKREEAAAEERERLAALAGDIGQALIQEDRLPEILRRCCEALVQHLDGAFARIWTLDEPGETLILQASAGMYTHTDGPHGRVPVGRFKIGLIAQECRPHLTNSVIGDPRVGDQEWGPPRGDGRLRRLSADGRPSPGGRPGPVRPPPAHRRGTARHGHRSQRRRPGHRAQTGRGGAARQRGAVPHHGRLDPATGLDCRS